MPATKIIAQNQPVDLGNYLTKDAATSAFAPAAVAQAVNEAIGADGVVDHDALPEISDESLALLVQYLTTLFDARYALLAGASTPSVTLSSIAINGVRTFAEGGTPTAYSATGTYSNGTTATLSEVTWTASEGSFTGNLFSLGNNTVTGDNRTITIRADSGGQSATITVNITDSTAPATPTGSGQIHDSFTRADNATSLGTTTTGQPWQTDAAGVLAIEGGKMVLKSGTGHSYVNFGSGDMDVQADVTFGNTVTSMGVVVNAESATKRLLFFYDPNTGRWTINRVEPSGTTPLTTSQNTPPVTPNTTYRLRFVSQGVNLIGYVNNVEVVKWPLSQNDATTFKGLTKGGVRITTATAGHSIDNFDIYTVSV